MEALESLLGFVDSTLANKPSVMTLLGRRKPQTAMLNGLAHLGLSGRPDRSITMVIAGNTICKRTGIKKAAEPLFVPRPKFVHWEISKPVAVKTNSNPKVLEI